MDAPTRYAFYDVLLKEYMAHPRMFILSTHLIEEVSSVFEDVVIIDKGKVLLHEATDDLLGRGISVTGAATAVNQFVEGLTVIGSRELGRTRSAMVYGELNDEQRRAARQAGLDLDPIDLQDLFVHLTTPKGDAA
jgi:ABC-2 type transport system ATP-binding protein